MHETLEAAERYLDAKRSGKSSTIVYDYKLTYNYFLKSKNEIHITNHFDFFKWLRPIPRSPRAEMLRRWRASRNNDYTT